MADIDPELHRRIQETFKKQASRFDKLAESIIKFELCLMDFAFYADTKGREDANQIVDEQIKSIMDRL